MHGNSNIKYIYDISLWSLRRTRRASDNSCREIQNTLLPSIIPPPLEFLPLYEIVWKSMVEPDRPQMTVWRMRFACWTTKATDTHSEYAILYCFSTDTIVTWTRINVTLYVHCLSCLGLLLKLGKFLIYSSSVARQLASDPILFSSVPQDIPVPC